MHLHKKRFVTACKLLKNLQRPSMPENKSRVGDRVEFATEADFVNRFVQKLARGRTAFGRVELTTEWDHSAGVVDVLARDRRKSLVAFEAKLADWRRAFYQAYRSTAYANRSYVLVPEQVAGRALRDREQFELRGVGLCSFNGSAVQVLIKATEQDALLRWLRAHAHEHFDTLIDEQRPGHRRSRPRPLSEARV